ncbi:hypothetical protein MNBD_CHLOROFLEXI01-4431 [hydrothermal vent metagenome]|uniref:Aminoglycoside phosphotransferase domain-containing protein n=1 Tax=hydrothermal vent metagenome TaxID=652676 RepID=A0A3B0VNE2_9ZZZZ
MNALLSYLANFPENGRFQDTLYQHISGGFNNVLYRITNEQHDLVVKFTVRDERRRARRELNKPSG